MPTFEQHCSQSRRAGDVPTYSLSARMWVRERGFTGAAPREWRWGHCPLPLPPFSRCTVTVRALAICLSVVLRSRHRRYRWRVIQSVSTILATTLFDPRLAGGVSAPPRNRLFLHFCCLLPHAEPVAADPALSVSAPALSVSAAAVCLKIPQYQRIKSYAFPLALV